MRDDRYRPADIDELESRPSFINQPPPPENLIPLPRRATTLHAALCEARINAQSLLEHLELGVRAQPGQAREVVRRRSKRRSNRISNEEAAPGAEGG